ncbi:MAG: phospholipase D family protein [Pseudomonadota bacterium]
MKSIIRLLRWLFYIFVLLWLITTIYHSIKPLPEGLSLASPEYSTLEVEFLADYTWVDQNETRHTEQRIFDRILERINQAERLIVLDKFLFNDFAGDPNGDGMRPLSDEISKALIQRKREVPELRIVFITDPINNLYGGLESEHLNALREAGIEIVMTDLTKLRDSNPLWSGFWRLCCQWFGNSSNGGWLPNPVGPEKVSLRSWLKLVNFKANHRKTLIVDTDGMLTGLVTSGNPHDASSAHGNVALEFVGPAVFDLLQTEQAVVNFSHPELEPLTSMPMFTSLLPAGPSLRVLTESKIRDYVIETLGQAEAGDRIDLAMFYLSHRGIVKALISAHERGVVLRVLLDPNEDAFGKKKNGVPNRQVAWELHRAGVSVRWCDTHGEQCHSKFMLMRPVSAADRESTMPRKPAELLLGSANFTRRNLDDFNLETNVLFTAFEPQPAMADAIAFFELRWHNGPNQLFSRPYDYYADESRLRYWQYRFLEATGLSTF